MNSDPEGLKQRQKQLTAKLEGLTAGTQPHTRCKLMLDEVEAELKEIENQQKEQEQAGQKKPITIPAPVPQVR